MRLKYALDSVSERIPNLNGYSVIVLKDFECLKRNLPVKKFRIYGVDIEDEDKEITLLTDEGAKTPTKKRPFIAKTLLHKLQRLMPRYKDYAMFSASAFIRIDKRYSARLDTPLITTAFDNEAKVVAFVQEGRKTTHNKGIHRIANRCGSR